MNSKRKRKKIPYRAVAAIIIIILFNQQTRNLVVHLLVIRLSWDKRGARLHAVVSGDIEVHTSTGTERGGTQTPVEGA